MAHFRKQLRDGIRARLQAAIPDVTVYSGRIVPFRDSELPAINILPIGDDVRGERQNVDRLERGVDIAVAILISGRHEETTDRADEIAEQLEAALVPTRDWSLPVKRFAYLACDIAPEPGADGVIIALTYRYAADVLHPAGRPGEPHNFRPTGA